MGRGTMDGGNGLVPRSRIGSAGVLGLHRQLPQHQMLPFQTPVAVDVGEDARCREEVVNDQARFPAAAPASQLWQRMKWIDDMVRLLIQVVHKVGDDGAGGGAEGEQHQQQAHDGKGKKSAAALHKKGKWKAVSVAMMEKGFCVSPQQCDDKFNDLNKRYKRVNDLLGKGTACRVVENPALLDSMHNISPKAKEEVRKLLNSKHLFFAEMCAYHHAAGASSCAADASPLPQPPDQPQICFYHPPQKALGGGRGGETVVVRAKYDSLAEEMEEDDENDMFSDYEDYYDAYEYEEDDDSVEEHNHKRHCQPGGDHVDDGNEFAKRHKRASSQMSASPLSAGSSSIQQLRTELMAMSVGGGGGGEEEQHRQWIGRRAAELEEQRVAFQSRALRLERQRFKWLHFTANKEREMQRMKLDNEHRRLDNDRMLLMLRQKEFELLHGGAAVAVEQQHPSNADPASIEA